MRKSALILSTCVLVLSSPAYGQSKKELSAQNAALSERISVLESRMLTGDPAAERLMQRIDALESSQRTLTGEVERLRFERDQYRAEVTALSDDIRVLEELATRTRIHLDAVDLVAKEKQSYQATQPYNSSTPHVYGGAQYPGTYTSDTYGSSQPYSSEISAIPSAPVMKELTLNIPSDYQNVSELPAAGKQKLAEGNFSGAQRDFQDYLAVLPDAVDAGEINFWLGETYFVNKAHANAADAYITSMRKDPGGVKAPDAMVRLAAALRELGKTTEACQTLDSFPAQYPNAPADVRDKARTEQLRTGC